MSKTGFQLDTRDFERVLEKYWEETKKDMAYCTNRQALNVTIKTAQNTGIAEERKIEQVGDQSWWPKYIASRIMGGGYKLAGKKGKKVGVYRMPGTKSQIVQGAYTVAQARAVSAAILRARQRHRGALRAGWIPAMKALSAIKAAMRGVGDAFRGTSKIKNPKGYAVLATPGPSPEAIIANSMSGATERGGPALQTGLNLAARDMENYLAERMRATAEKAGLAGK